MSPRYLSFLALVEKSLAADEPSPRGGSWSVERTVNHHLGLARMRIGSRALAGAISPLGEITMQSYTLADGSLCLKSLLSYAGLEEQRTHDSFPRSDDDWKTEARRVAAEWLAGYSVLAESDSENRMAEAS